MSKIDQAKLTAYALGELRGAEAKEIEQLVKADPEARRYVDEVRMLGKELEFELSDEPIPAKSSPSFTRSLTRNWEWAVVACAVLIAAGVLTRRHLDHELAQLPAEDALSSNTDTAESNNIAVATFLGDLLQRPSVPAPVADCRFSVPRPGRNDEHVPIADSKFEGLQSKTSEFRYQLAIGAKVETLAVLLGAVSGSSFSADPKDIVQEEGKFRLVFRRTSPQSSAVFAFLNTTAQFYCWASVKYEGNLDGTMLSEIAGKIQALASKIAASVAK